jgi:hypothetical protein
LAPRWLLKEGVSTKPSHPRRKRPKRPKGSFRPPFCPNPLCKFHWSTEDWKYVSIGSNIRQSDQRSIPRFLCLACRRSFSSVTFRATYWLRYRHLFLTIAKLSVAGSGLRQIARTLGIAHSTVSRHLQRAGRQSLLRHQELTQDHRIEEPIAADGFETFEFSQYFPCHYNLAVGAGSWFIYFFNDSPLRRKGRMTAAQRLRRAELEARLGRPDPQAVEKAMAELAQELVRALAPEKTLVLRTDEHPAYPRALRRLPHQHPQAPPIDHQTTPSRAARTPQNPLFPINALDTFLRHSQANHRRETIAFNKRRQGGLERLAVFALWRNYIKKHHENGPEETPAMRAGILNRRMAWREMFRRRLFPGHLRMPASWKQYYWRRVKTAALGDRQTELRAKYAF